MVGANDLHSVLHLMRSGLLYLWLRGAVGGALLPGAGGSEEHTSKNGEGEYFFHCFRYLGR